VNIVGAIATILNSLLLLFVIVLLVRLVLDWVPFFNREWRPKGAGLVAAEIVYTVTDPPIKMFRASFRLSASAGSGSTSASPSRCSCASCFWP